MHKKRCLLILLIFIIAIPLLSACGGSSNTSIVGKYYSEKGVNNVAEFKEDGTFHLTQDGQVFEGKYTNKNGTITFEVNDGSESTGKIEGNVFTDNDGIKWTKK